MSTQTELTDETVRRLREAKRISRKDFESWTYDPEAERRVRSALADYRHATWLSGIDDPVGGRHG